MQNLKIFNSDSKEILEIKKYKLSIRRRPKNLESYDLLSNHYVLSEKLRTADFILTHEKKAVIENLFCYGPELLADVGFDPFDWTTDLSQRLGLDIIINDLEDFFEKILVSSIKRSYEHFIRVEDLLPKTFQMKVFSILMNKRIWVFVKAHHHLMEATQDYLDKICDFFDHTDRFFEDHHEELLKVVKLLMRTIAYKNEKEYDRECTVYTAFMIALFTYLKEKNVFSYFENHLTPNDMFLLKDIWGFKQPSIDSLLEELWDRRTKQ